MHTIMVISGGLLLLAAFVFGGRAAGIGTAAAALWFMPVWLAGAALNMAVGVSRAGYTVAQEFPIFLVVFAVPALLALLVRWKSGRRAGDGGSKGRAS